MRRREFVALIGIAVGLWPHAGSAQQPAMRRVGVLFPGSLADSGHFASAFAQGLKDIGYVDGETASIEYRWGEGRNERLSGLVSDLLNHGAAVIAVGGPQATLAAKAATSTVPIVAVFSDSASLLGLVGNMSRPQANLTGVAPFASAAMWRKPLELLRETLAHAKSVAIFANPTDESSLKTEELAPMAHALGLELVSVAASADAEIEAAFATAVHQHVDGILVSDQPFFTVRRDRIAALAGVTLYRLSMDGASMSAPGGS